jgi:8-amino-7-oxononanoate synthase
MLTTPRELRQPQLRRVRQLRDSPTGVASVVNGHKVESFCSNDYLGLANHPEVITAFQRAAADAGVGAGGAALVSGYHSHHQALEEALAEFLQRPRVLLFNSGYTQNLGILACLIGSKDSVFADRLVHASLIDGVRLSQAKLRRYRHLDMPHLRALLSVVTNSKTFIVTDSVFSMDGTQAPLAEMMMLAAEFKSTLLVDDAHGFGVLGSQGRGVLDTESGQALPWVMATLGKALGVYGGFVSGTEAAIEHLIQHARSYIYTTALPPAIAAAAHQALRIVQRDAWRREHLQSLIAYFQQAAAQLGLPVLVSTTPIQPLIIGSAELALQLSEDLFARGYQVKAIGPPTVAANQARLRITLTAEHTQQQVDALLSTISSILNHDDLKRGV